MSSSRTTMHYVNYYVISGHVFLLPQNSWKKRLVHPSSIIHHHHLFIVVRYARVLYYVFLSEIRIFVIIIIVVIIVLSIFIDLSNAY